MSETKLELVLNYIENQMNISQGSLPMTEASREFIRKTNSRCGQKAAEQLSTANTETSEAIAQHQQQQQLNRRRREKRASLRKDLHSPTKGTRNELPAAHNGTTVAATTSSHAAVSAHCFGAIHAQPSKKKEPKRHLGIFNKGKAVASKSSDSGALDFDAEAANSMSADSVIAGGMRRPRSQDIAPTRRSRAKLLASIEEYLNQDDKYGSFTPRGLSFGLDGVSDSEGLDISALFDEHNDEGTPRFNSHNFSSTGLSELDSCIFASGDVQGLRHPGNIAISDFGNSRYGPGFHGLDIFALTDQSRGSLDSTDTLPEYMFREELPPPYLSLEDSSHIDRDYANTIL
ncbi:hypothetical protein EV178_003262 [Coemansia sp. RSA 1646]|nr:hypothetical protein EV178_003262 [Coemansia sp. RSA 1646]